MTDPRLHPKNRIPIYFDPITQKRIEGLATLVSLVAEEDDDGCELWEVKFANNYSNRRIKVMEG